MSSENGIRRSTLRQFLPASLVLMLPGIFHVPPPDQLFSYYAQVALVLGGLGIGFAGVRELVCRWTGTPREVGTRRTILTGLAAVPMTGIAFNLLSWSPLDTISGLLATMFAAGLGAGSLLGASTFIRRRTPRLPKRLRELPGESLEEWFERVEREAERVVRRLAQPFRALRGAA